MHNGVNKESALELSVAQSTNWKSKYMHYIISSFLLHLWTHFCCIGSRMVILRKAHFPDVINIDSAQSSSTADGKILSLIDQLSK